MQKVTCIIVTYNASRWIYNCLNSIKESKIDLQIVIIDNNSKDETLEIISKNFPHVSVFPQSENLGFAAANNLGLEKAYEYGSEFIYLLNQDTVSYPDTIYKLIQCEIANKNSGIISPLHLNDSGEKLDEQFERCISATSSPLLISDFLLNKNKRYYKIGFVNAAAWLISVKTIEKVGGLFSSAFFHYGEDNNFVGRLRHFGYKVYIDTNTFIHHCREERKGKKSIAFLRKELFIKSQIKLYSINETFSSAFLGILKYSINQLIKGNITTAIMLLWNPLYNYRKIKRIRKSYMSNKII